jgi:hypothetical protein
MSTAKKKSALSGYINRKCAGAMTSGPCESCKVTKGRRCGYFEKAVFPECDPAYPYSDPKEHKNHFRILSQYRKLHPNFKRKEDIDGRVCDCGNALPFGQQICNACRQRRRRKSRRLGKVR